MDEISNLIKETYRAQTYATARRNICTGENCKRYAVCLHIGLLYNKKKSILRSIAIDFCVRFRYFFFCRNKTRLCNIYCMFVRDV